MCIDSFTDFADVRIDASGQVFRFDFSHRFGPAMLGTRGQEIDKVPPRRSPFWSALQSWVQQGCSVVDGWCVYEPPPIERWVQLVGRHYTQVPSGADPAQVRREYFEKLGLPEPLTTPKVVEMPAG